MKLLMYAMYSAALSVLSTMVIYPFCHEMGHYLGARLAGCDVMGVKFVIDPKITLCVNNAMSLVLSAFGGVLLPLVVALMLPDRYFCLSAVKVMILMMDILVVMYSMVCLACYLLGSRVLYDDMVSVAVLYPDTVYINMLLLACIATLSAVYMKKKRIFLHMYKHLEMKIYGTNNKTGIQKDQSDYN